MKTFKTGQQKIQEICDVLRRDTLDPAQKEAQTIIDEAKERAEEIIKQAQRHAEDLLNEVRRNIEQERNVFNSSLAQAGRQSLESLRQSIEQKLFNEELHTQIAGHTADPKVIANLINAIVKAIDKDGVQADLTAIIPAAAPAKEIIPLLAEGVLNKLKNKSLALGDFDGGVKVRLEGKKLVLDISNEEIEDLLQRYLRKDFRKLIFE